jgi:hypothetical protein
MRIFGIAVLLAGAISGAPEAHADLPAATGGLACSSYYGAVNDPSSCTAGFASGTRTLTPDTSIGGKTSYPGQFYYSTGGVEGTTTYDFTVTGGATGDIVPIDIDASVDATASNAYAFSRLIVTTGGDNYFAQESVAENPICDGTCSHTFDGTLHLNAKVGLDDSVYMEIEVETRYDNDVQSATASVDPYIYIDPTFARASDYGIEVSPDVGNTPVSTVPEPGTWGLMLTGFGILGSTLRGRRFAASLLKVARTGQ